MSIPADPASPVASTLTGARRTAREGTLSEQSQSTRDFLEMEEMASELVSTARSREESDRTRSRVTQYSHPSRVNELLAAVDAGLAEANAPEADASDERIVWHGDRVEVRHPKEILRRLDQLEELIKTADEQPAETVAPADSISEHPRVEAFAWPSAVATNPCVICGGTTALRKYSIEGVSEQLVECVSCGLGSLFPMPDVTRIKSFYPAEYYGTPSAKFEPLVESGVRAGSRARVRSLLKGIPAGSHVLDVGCGRGVMLRAALDLGYTAHGVEISAEAAAGVDPRAHVRIASDLTEAGYETNSMDAVVLWHVLEHLPQPGRTLSEIRRILKPGGRLVLAVPNFASWQSRWAGADWFHLDLPRHLYHFSPDTLSLLLHRHGFAKQSCRHFAALQNPFGWLQSAFNRASGSPRNSLYSLLHRGGDHEDARSLSPAKRFLFKAAFAVGLPIAAAVSLLEAALGEGGTIAVTAELGCVERHPEPADNSRRALAAAY
ncbi:MAG: class I SAM-dependent methyltransferase [Planctomycetota bacterium]|nr:class I SAM-dependent methyltransferase [Planctomycetota bacterium]MDA1248922.1 class I SAM-dependent methyltransferase [Planctomycetota bacterium]